nr:MAG TPA: hypothetical protein [Caudoviricetes sp.]
MVKNQFVHAKTSYLRSPLLLSEILTLIKMSR